MALRGLNSAGRKSLVEAVAKTIAYDDRLTLREAELLRTICATLDCPLPPVISMHTPEFECVIIVPGDLS